MRRWLCEHQTDLSVVAAYGAHKLHSERRSRHATKPAQCFTTREEKNTAQSQSTPLGQANTRNGGTSSEIDNRTGSRTNSVLDAVVLEMDLELLSTETSIPTHERQPMQMSRNFVYLTHLASPPTVLLPSPFASPTLIPIPLSSSAMYSTPPDYHKNPRILPASHAVRD